MMMETNNDFIKQEILIKENERFRLDEIGFIADIESTIDEFCNTYIDDGKERSFSHFKQNFLTKFYAKYRFDTFIRNNYSNKKVIWLNKRLMRKSLKEHQSECMIDSIDNVLRMRDNSIAFFISTSLFAELYPQLLDGKMKIITPYSLFTHCKKFVEERFPLTFEQYFNQLRLNDTEFWDKTYIIVRKQITSVTKVHSASLSNRNDMIDDITSSTYLLIVDKFTTDKSIDFKDALAFKSYVYRIGHNKMMELLRKIKKDNIIENYEYIDNIPYNDVEDEINDSNDLLDIDVTNDFDVANAISVILCDGEHPLRTRLIGDDRERVELFIMKYADDKDYDYIINLKYGVVNGVERKRLYDTMRQNMVRTRAKLIANFKKIISDEKLR